MTVKTVVQHPTPSMYYYDIKTKLANFNVIQIQVILLYMEKYLNHPQQPTNSIIIITYVYYHIIGITNSIILFKCAIDLKDIFELSLIKYCQSRYCLEMLKILWCKEDCYI